MDTIVIVNRTTVLTDDQVRNVLSALQAQVSEDFAPIWGIDAKLEFAGLDEPDPSGGAWPLFLMDTTDQAGVGGFHMDDNGRVFGRVFCKDAIDAGEAWTVDASHELLEMLADPTAGTDQSKYVDLRGLHWIGRECLLEVCDAVEADEFGYEKPGADGKPVLLSDFVTPEYFYRKSYGVAPRPGTYDFRGKLEMPAPFVLLDGYLGIYEPATGMWSQVSDFRQTGRRSRRPERMGRTRFAMERH